MAPELIRGMHRDRAASARQFDARSDLYSLGAVLYELLTGRLPVKPPDADRLPPDAFEPWLASRAEPIPPPRSINPAIDAELERIVVKLLADDPGGRYATAAELAADLRRYGRLPKWAQRFAQRNRRAILAAGIGVAAAAITGGAYWSSLPPYEQRLFAKGLEQYEQGEYAKAVETFSECLALKPNWPEAHFARGQANRHVDIAAARSDFLELQQFDLALAYKMAGYCDLEMGNGVGAAEDYALAIQAGAKDATTLHNMGSIRWGEQRYTSAVEYLTQALSADSQSAITYYVRARTGADQANSSSTPVPEFAFADFEEACRLVPESAEFHFYAATAYARSAGGRFDHEPKIAEHLFAAVRHGYPVEGIAANRQPLGIQDEMLDQLHAQRKAGLPPFELMPTHLSPSESPHLSDVLGN
jgi:tetratricopeptide (TPR) repeat protein